MLVTILFYAFSLVLLVAAFGVILSKNPVHSALCLVLTFFTAAAIWLLAQAEFLAIVLVLVYVGAVMVLFLFVVMMLDVNVAALREGFTRYAPVGVIVAAVMVAELLSVIWLKTSGLPVGRALATAGPDHSNTREIGTILYTKYAYPFELAAVLLLVAIVAAIALTMRRRRGLKVQDVSRQVATRRGERVSLVKVESGRGAATQEKQP